MPVDEAFALLKLSSVQRGKVKGQCKKKSMLRFELFFFFFLVQCVLDFLFLKSSVYIKNNELEQEHLLTPTPPPPIPFSTLKEPYLLHVLCMLGIVGSLTALPPFVFAVVWRVFFVDCMIVYQHRGVTVGISW